jgi:DNA polymerase alpha subunit B
VKRQFIDVSLSPSSLYPVFPVPTELSHEVNLDVSHLDGLALTYDSDEPAADVLVLPSRYKQFCKVDPEVLIH